MPNSEENQDQTLAALAKSPFLGTTVPLGAALAWVISMANTNGEQMKGIQAGQVGLQIQMAEVSSGVTGNREELAVRSGELKANGDGLQAVRAQLAMLSRDAQDLKASAAALESRIVAIETKGR